MSFTHDRVSHSGSQEKPADTGSEEPTILEMLSLRILARYAPEALAAISRSEVWQPYENILVLYVGEKS